MSWKKIHFATVVELKKALPEIENIGQITAFRDDGLGDIFCYEHIPSCSVYINTEHALFLEKIYDKYSSIEYAADVPMFNDNDWFWSIL